MKLFEDLVKKQERDEECIGLGNPNANILFIGKEAGVSQTEKVVEGSKGHWKNDMANPAKEYVYAKKYVPEARSNLRNFNHTWQKYQKLYDFILKEVGKSVVEKEAYEINFVENVFTTELSTLHAPNSDEAKEIEDFDNRLAERKEIFFKDEFIQNFQIVVIFASDTKYIQRHQREVREMFGVEFTEMFQVGRSKLWEHKGLTKSEKAKLVIHTRQLVNGAPNALIEKIAERIGKFIKENKVEIDFPNTKLEVSELDVIV